MAEKDTKIINQVFDNTGNFVCLACGKTEDPNKLLPMPLEDFARFCEIFTEIHTLKGCNKKKPLNEEADVKKLSISEKFVNDFLLAFDKYALGCPEAMKYVRAYSALSDLKNK